MDTDKSEVVESVDCMRCAHLPMCIYVASKVSDFRFPAEGGTCDMYLEDTGEYPEANLMS